MKKVLFLDQSGKLGGAELCLLDIAKSIRSTCKVLLFSGGAFAEALEKEGIQVSVLQQDSIDFRKESGILDGIASSFQVVPLLLKVIRAVKDYDVIYANTPKALVIGALVNLVSRKTLIYHLHDIISESHFSTVNRFAISTLAKLADRVIANSYASKEAFIQASGAEDSDVSVVYNGFDIQKYDCEDGDRSQIRQALDIDDRFVVGHFSRLSPWKGQDVLLDALAKCPDDVVVLFVGDALFGEDDYVQALQQQVAREKLEHRVQFLGFRHDIPQLMSACDLIAHTSTAPEPFGRVIVEAMLCNRPVIGAKAGGAMELIEHGKTGWLCPPNDSEQLADCINYVRDRVENSKSVAKVAQEEARRRFSLTSVNAQILELIAPRQVQVKRDLSLEKLS